MMAAALKERVRFDPADASVNDFGEVTGGFSSGSECRAFYTYLRTGESVMAARLAGRQTIAVRIRRTASTEAIDGTYRMVDIRTSRVFNVKGVEPSQDRRWLEILVEGGETVVALVDSGIGAMQVGSTFVVS